MDPEEMQNAPINWSHFKLWQVIDPAIPWNILEREKLREILVAQLEVQVQAMQNQVAYLKKVQEIVRK